MATNTTATCNHSNTAYKKMCTNLEKKLTAAQQQIQQLKKQLENANKQQKVEAQKFHKKEQLLKSTFAKKQQVAQQNLTKKIKLIERKWQDQLNNKINTVKEMAFKQGLKESERCVQQISKQLSQQIHASKPQANSPKSSKRAKKYKSVA